MGCTFCGNISRLHLCADLFTYEYIFKQLFINVLLDFQPKSKEVFFQNCVDVLSKSQVLRKMPNTCDVMLRFLEKFVEDYECFI